MRKKILSPLLGTLLVLSACSKEKEKEAEPVLQVQLADVRSEPIQKVIRAEGVLRAIDQSAVMPKISAPVSKFFVNRGDHVRKGQLLATLENRDLAAAVVDSKGTYEQASANYRNVSAATVPDEMVKAQSDVQAARQQADAAKKLLDSREQLLKEGALARKLVDEAMVAYAQARSQYETAQKHLESLQRVGRHEETKAAQAQMDSAKGRYEAAQAQLSYSEVRSPINGVVADRALFAGEMASAGAALLTIVDVSSIIARVNVPQAEAALVRVGQPAHIRSTDRLTEVNGKVTVVSPAVDPQSTTVEIWLQAANPGGKLRPGGTVQVEITTDTIPDATVVPAEALLPAEEGGSALYAVGSDLVAHQRKIEIGVRTPEKVQILSGVKPGEKVVVSGGVGLQDGAKVKLAEAAGKNDKKDDDKDDKKEDKHD